PDLDQPSNDVADAPLVLAAIDDARVLHADRAEPQEVLILSGDHPPFGEGMGRLLLVGRPHQANFGSRRDVDSVTPQALADGRRAVLIEVEAYRSRHRPAVAESGP